MIRLRVWHKGKCIDHVFYADSFLAGFKNLRELKASVKKALVEHDGYAPDIEITG